MNPARGGRRGGTPKKRSHASRPHVKRNKILRAKTSAAWRNFMSAKAKASRKPRSDADRHSPRSNGAQARSTTSRVATAHRSDFWGRRGGVNGIQSFGLHAWRHNSLGCAAQADRALVEARMLERETGDGWRILSEILSLLHVTGDNK